jgi:hypothetical protein
LTSKWASDLENNDWGDLVIDDARLAEYKADHAWIRSGHC